MSLLDSRAVRDWVKQNFLKKQDVLKTEEELVANEEAGKSVDSLVVKQVFTSVSSGKSLIASAITDKGVQTDVTATFTEMANNIGNIQGGGGGDFGITVKNDLFTQLYKNKVTIIDIKKYTESYMKLKVNETLFVVPRQIKVDGSSVNLSGSSYDILQRISYNAETGVLSVTSSPVFGFQIYVYIVEVS